MNMFVGPYCFIVRRLKLIIGINFSLVIIFVGYNFRRHFFEKKGENFVILTDENYNR